MADQAASAAAASKAQLVSKFEELQGEANVMNKRFLHSEKFAAACNVAFDQVDGSEAVKADGELETHELWVAVLLLYNQLNANLPVHLDPPGRKAVQDMVKSVDTDGSGTVNREEFLRCAQGLFTMGPTGLYTTIVKEVSLACVVLPFLTYTVEKANLFGITSKVPAVFVSPALSYGLGRFRTAPREQRNRWLKYGAATALVGAAVGLACSKPRK